MAHPFHICTLIQKFAFLLCISSRAAAAAAAERGYYSMLNDLLFFFYCCHRWCVATQQTFDVEKN